MCTAQQVITKLMLVDFDFEIQVKLILTKSKNLFILLAYVKNTEYNIPLLSPNKS